MNKLILVIIPLLFVSCATFQKQHVVTVQGALENAYPKSFIQTCLNMVQVVEDPMTGGKHVLGYYDGTNICIKKSVTSDQMLYIFVLAHEMKHVWDAKKDGKKLGVDTFTVDRTMTKSLDKKLNYEQEANLVGFYILVLEYDDFEWYGVEWNQKDLKAIYKYLTTYTTL